MQHLVDKCFKSIPNDGTVILAVSGGSDSMALLLLANVWATKHNVHLQAVTIDHGLRPEAAAEAAFVASACNGLNIDHVTLAWEGSKPALGIPNAARQSRYNLLDQFAHEIGSDVILTGHTLDDQAETVYMRNQRHIEGSDGRGVSGMARRTWLYGGTQIYRPLLGISRFSLRKILNEFSQSWIEDPSNIDESYERVRVRKRLLENPEIAVKHLALAHVSGRLREISAQDCATFLLTHVNVLPGPVFELSFDHEQFKKLGKIHPIVLQAIQNLIGLAGGQAFLTPKHRLEPGILDLVMGEASRFNIGGCVIENSKKQLRFYREARNLRSIVLEPGESAIWDGRLHIENETATTVFVEAAKRSFLKEYEKLKGKAFDVKPRQALWSTPVIHVQVSDAKSSNAPSACLPLLDQTNLPAGLHVRLATPSIEHFCPQFDEALRMWVISLDRFSAASIYPKG